MQTVNYEGVREALYYRESYTHGSSHAIRNDYTPGRYIYPSTYRVYSYNTLILVYNLDSHTVEYFDNRDYSVTTSKLQNMIKEAFPSVSGERFSARVVYDGTIEPERM